MKTAGLLTWYVRNGLPESYTKNARNEAAVFQRLDKLAAKLKPGESGLLALNWWNGNRTPLMDFDLSGVLMGCTLTTKPEEIYRALIEATAFNSRLIIDTFRENGIEVNEFYAVGGIPKKNQLLMQVYADVIGAPIHASEVSLACAQGSAIYAAVAAGAAGGGYGSMDDAIDEMSCKDVTTYNPEPGTAEAYGKLYESYKNAFFLLGRENKVLKELKALKAQIVSMEQ